MTQTEAQPPPGAAPEPRPRLLAGLPIEERRLDLAGVSTAVLEGGDGPPLVLLHEPGSFAAHWLRVIPELVKARRVIAPDLPGHGASGTTDELDERWEPFEAYTLDRARSPEGKAALRVMMRELAVPAIRPGDLERLGVPTTLIWGRQDPVNRLRVAEAASERYGWPLHVIEDAGDDAPIEQPEQFLGALGDVLRIGGGRR